ncbi:MAG: choice-of-anchor B family protein [Planctomycetes bacterium]|nr:choice-of-anchor B family protein [Planctomycetota bacterium]
MTRLLRLAVLALSALATLSGSLLAHEDDGKVLDRERPRFGPGYRSPLGVLGEPLSAVQGSGGPGGYNLNPFSSSNVKLLAQLPLNTWGGNQQNGNSGWGYVSPSGREYALMGLYGGTAFVEITTPGQPVSVGYIAGPNSLWRDVRVYKHPTLGHFAYAASEGGSGIQVINITNIDSGVVTLMGTVTTGPSPSATHTIEVNQQTGYLYRAGGGSNGLRIYNLNATPATPTYVSSWTTRYVHEVTLVNYTSGPLAGKEIAFACSGGQTNTGIDILDVTNKTSITAVTPRLTWAGGSYSHQCSLSSDKQYLYVNDELYLQNHPGQPTINFVFNIGNLGTSAPTYVGSFTNGNPAIPHNEYVAGTKLYQAAYRSGLRVWDIGATPRTRRRSPGSTPTTARTRPNSTVCGTSTRSSPAAWSPAPTWRAACSCGGWERRCSRSRSPTGNRRRFRTRAMRCACKSTRTKRACSPRAASACGGARPAPGPACRWFPWAAVSMTPTSRRWPATPRCSTTSAPPARTTSPGRAPTTRPRASTARWRPPAPLRRSPTARRR